MSSSTSSRQPSAAPKGCNILPCCECCGFWTHVDSAGSHVLCSGCLCMGAQLLWEQGAHMGDGQGLQV